MERRAGRLSRVAAPLLFITGLVGTLSAGVLTNVTSVADGAGGWCSGGAFSNICAVAQPPGVSVSAGGSLVNYAGFLGAFILRPGLDSDGDGCANELDGDNDNDDLGDVVEIAGTAFSPATATDVDAADSDADGASDGEEAAAGTDPWDTNAVLRIVAFDVTNSATIAWVARSNYTYCIARSTNLLAGGGGFVGVDTVTVHAVASAPWYVVTNEYLDVTSAITNHAVYRIEVR